MFNHLEEHGHVKSHLNRKNKVAKSEIRQNVYFVFCSESASKWSKLTFNPKFKHVFMIVSDGEESVIYRPSGFGILLEQLGKKTGNEMWKFLDRLANQKWVSSVVGVAVDQSTIQRDAQPFIKLGVTCSELCRIGSGIDIGHAFTPFSLFSKLFKFNKRRNFKVFFVR